MKHTKRGSTHYRVGFTSRHRWGKRMSTATFPEGFDSTYDNKSIHLLAHHSSRTRSKAAAFTVALGLAFVALPAVGVGAATTPTPPNQTVAQATVPGDAAATAKTLPGDMASVNQVRAAAVPAAAAGPAVVTLGFDDQRVSQASVGPLLTARGFRGTFYVISQFIDEPVGAHPESLTMAQLKSLEAAGNEIGGHTQTHPDLALASQTVQTAEICGGRTDLISDGFKAPVSFAYPYGSFNASAETVANSCGFTNARTVSDGPESIPPAVPMATAAMPSVQAVANATDPAVTVAQMEGWVTGAESGNKKWVQVVWHDIVTQGSQAGDEYYQLTPDFTAFLDWLKGEATAGRAVVKTAGEAVGGAAPIPAPIPAPTSIKPYGAIGALWTAKGGSGAILGLPLDNESDVPGVAGARVEDFTGGKIYWSGSTGAHEVHGAILSKYLGWGGPVGYGLPVTDETVTPDGVGRFNHFTAGRSIYWTPGTGAHTVYGAIRAEWQAIGWELGVMGYPTSDESDAVGGRYNNFQGGAITWSVPTGAHETHGAIRATWAATGFESGPLGFPVTDEFAIPNGRQSTFQHGYITWDSSTGAVKTVLG